MTPPSTPPPSRLYPELLRHVIERSSDPEIDRPSLPSISSFRFRVIESGENFAESEPFTVAFPSLSAGISEDSPSSGRDYRVNINWDGENIPSRSRVIIKVYIRVAPHGRVKHEIAERNFSDHSFRYRVTLHEIERIYRDHYGISPLRDVDIDYIWFTVSLKGWDRIIWANTMTCYVR